MKKVLITYASYGMGHVKAASNLGQMINSDFDVTYLNLSKYAHPFLENIIIKISTIMVTYLPFLYKMIYYNATYRSYRLVKRFYGNKKVAKKIIRINPDIVIATHFMSEAALVYLKKKYHLNYKICFLLTDYHVNNYVVKPLNKIDKYFVATNELKKECLKLGIKNNHICVSSIPVSTKFNQKLSRHSLLKKYNLSQNKKTILYVCGGMGIVKNLYYLKKLLSLNYNFQFIFVAGKNKRLKNKVTKIVDKYNKKGIVLGFTDKMNELIFLSDLVIGKSGGLITSECIKMKKFMVVISPIIGQESENAHYLEKNNLGIYIKDKNEFDAKINYLLKHNNKPNKTIIKYRYKEELNKL